MSRLIRALEATPRLRLVLVAYGLAIAIVGSAAWAVAYPDSHVKLQQSRQDGIAGSIAVLDQGGPPLVERRGASYVSASQGDDAGIYLVLGELGHLTGTRDPVTLFKDVSTAAMAVLVALAPLAAFLLFDSVLLALLAPLGVLVNFPVLAYRDIYFVSAWIVLLGLPIAYLVVERAWSRKLALTLLGVAAFAAGCCNAIRAHSGTGVAVALAAAAFMRERSWRARIGGIAVVAVLYVAASPIGLSLIQSHAFSDAHVPDQSNAAAHTLWHPAYLGLGYLPNSWGIRWSDSAGAAEVHRIDPSARYLSPRYEQILRHQYVSIVGHHPFWVARLYAVKTAALIWDAVTRGGILALLLLPAALFLGRRRELLRRRLLLLVPALVFAVLPPLLAIPKLYDSGLIACFDLAGALALGSLVGASLTGPRTRAVLVTATLVACTIAAAITTHVFAAQVARQISG